MSNGNISDEHWQEMLEASKIKKERRVREGTWSVLTWWDHQTTATGQVVRTAGSKITDHRRRVTYWATAVDAYGGPELTYLAIRRHGDKRIGQDVLRHVPTQAIARVAYEAAQQLKAGEAFVLSPSVQPRRKRRPKPDAKELAAMYAKHPRLDVAQYYGVQPSTLDNWVADLRRDGVMPPAKGRPRGRKEPIKPATDQGQQDQDQKESK